MIKAGDEVTVLRPESLLRELQKRIAGRSAIVDRVFRRAGGFSDTAVITFPPAGRRKSFQLHMDVTWLEKKQ
jgi:hypothetical protein